jgi:hypothetical protein
MLLGRASDCSREARLIVSPIRCVLHVQIGADGADDYRARVDSDPHLKLESALPLERGGIIAQSTLNPQGCVNCPARGILMRDRRAE